MYFSDLCNCNKDWDETTQLIIVSNNDNDAFFLHLEAACSLYGDCKVIWFRDCVVMLE